MRRNWSFCRGNFVELHPVVCTVNGSPTSEYIWLSLCCRNVKQPNVGAATFDDIASLMYNLLDAKRHWKSYLAHVKLIPIASAASLPSQPSDRKPSSAGIIIIIIFFKILCLLHITFVKLQVSVVVTPLLCMYVCVLAIGVVSVCLSVCHKLVLYID